MTSTFGGFKKRITDVKDVNLQDIQSPWNFFLIFLSAQLTVITWMQSNGLLASQMECEKCKCNCVLKPATKSIDGYVWRCRKNSKHDYSIRKLSFFFKSKLSLQDVMLFLRNFCEQMPLHRIALTVGINYSTVAVNWASYIREIFMQWYEETLKNYKLKGEIEIDESLFGRTCKYHRGRAKGVRVWILGLVERETGKLLLFPVTTRDENTLIPIILEHVQKGSTIYTDSWGAYNQLNQHGYNHFTVCHKYSFKQIYRNTITGELITVHTNTIEGAWCHAKEHFRRINGTSIGNFEGHMAEILFINHHRRTNLLLSVLSTIITFYNLHEPFLYTYSAPLFPSWHASKEDTIRRSNDKNDECAQQPFTDPPPSQNAYSPTDPTYDPPMVASLEPDLGSPKPSTSKSPPITPDTQQSSPDSPMDDARQCQDEDAAAAAAADASGSRAPIDERFVTFRKAGRAKRRHLRCPRDFQPLPISDEEWTETHSRTPVKKTPTVKSSRGRIIKKKRISWAQTMSTDSDFD